MQQVCARASVNCQADARPQTQHLAAGHNGLSRHITYCSRQQPLTLRLASVEVGQARLTPESRASAAHTGAGAEVAAAAVTRRARVEPLARSQRLNGEVLPGHLEVIEG